MALARRSISMRDQSFIWPGFVDGLATLLMVILFVLMVFFLVQTNLAQRLYNQDATLSHLRSEISTLAYQLNLSQQRAANLASERDQLRTALTNLRDETDITSQNLIRQRNELQAQYHASNKEILEMTLAMTALAERVEALQALLDEKTAEAREAKEVSVNLTKQLNEALSSKVAELNRFRSEFFGRLRAILQGRSDIAIVGDRFIFQSEVLFGLGSADIDPQGKAQLQDLAATLQQLAAQIPDDIDWILQINGHTDNVPIRNNDHRDNWSLSTARALAVLRFMAEQGIPPNRLAATGYGEFQPIAPDENPQARARNRRIEFKLTYRASKE